MPTGNTPYGRYCTNAKGYPRLKTGPFKDKYVHRVVFEQVAGRAVREGFHIHHMDHDKLNFCPCNLLEVQAELHPAREHPRCPWTGRFLTRRELDKLREERKRSLEEVPF